MQGTPLFRIIVGGILTGIALYYTIEATVYFYVSHSVMDSYVYYPTWLQLVFRTIPGLAFALIYWRVGSAINPMSLLAKGIFVGMAFFLLNATIEISDVYEFIVRGYYFVAFETVVSTLLINIVMGYLIVIVVPVYPMGEQK